MENLLEVLRFLSAPFEEEQWKLKTTTDCASKRISDITEKCMRTMRSTQKTRDLLEHGGGPVSECWKLTCLLLDLLLQLKYQVELAEINQPDEERSIHVLSLQSQLNVQKCVELVMGFGVIPYLVPGVGVPQKLRPSNPLASEMFLAEDLRVRPLIQYHRLAQVLDIVIHVSSQPSLYSLVIPKHTIYLLPALLQICKFPIARPPQSSDNESESAKSLKPCVLTQAEYEYLMKIQKRLAILMECAFLDKLSKSLLVQSLFILGSTVERKEMKNSCDEMLYEIILSPNGLILISSTLLAAFPVSSNWKLARIVSDLMRDALTLNNKEKCQVDRLTDICSQCIQMIVGSNQEDTSYHGTETETETGSSSSIDCSKSFSKPTDITNDGKEFRKTLARFAVNQDLSRIGLFCSIVLMDVNCQLTKTLVWDHLFESLLELGQCQSRAISTNSNLLDNRVNEEMRSVDIKKVIKASEVAEGLLTLVIPSDLCLPLQTFQPLWSLFFKLFVACKEYQDIKIQDPDVAKLSEMLVNKLENVLIVLLEIVSSGAGDKLDVTSRNRNNINNSRSTGSIFANKDTSTTTISDNMNKERAQSVCDFCFGLLLNEKESGVNKFQLIKSHNEMESIKIVQVTSQTTAGSQPNKNNAFEVLGDECAILCSAILKHERMERIRSHLFCQLLSYGSDCCEQEAEKECENSISEASESQIKSSGPQSAKSRELTELELQDSIKSKGSLRKFIALKLVSDLGGDDMVVQKCVKAEDFQETLSFLELIMRKLTVELKASSCTGEDYDLGQSVILSLGILGRIVETAAGATGNSCGQLFQSSNNSEASRSQKKMSPENRDQDKRSSEVEKVIWDELKIFTPHLRILHETKLLGLINLGIPDMAETVLFTIETRGGMSTVPGKQKLQVVSSRYERALKDVSNPMLPIKGLGLLELRKLIEEQDPETLRNQETCFQIFEQELTNQDSYVYLMAIHGMSALGLKFHKLLVPVLIREYDFINPGKEGTDCPRAQMYQVMTKDQRIDCRMKIGEVLVKIVQKLGDIAPVHRAPLTNLFFRLVRDEEPLIRASALSNLAELCHLLKFSLGVVLTEVWFCVEWILRSEKDLQVRRGALQLLVLLLKGVQKDLSPEYLLMDLQLGTYLRDVRRLLTGLEQGERDTVSKTHAQLALQELKLILHKVLHPSQQGLSTELGFETSSQSF